MKIEINGIPKKDKQAEILQIVSDLLKLFESYKYNYEESKGK